MLGVANIISTDDVVTKSTLVEPPPHTRPPGRLPSPVSPQKGKMLAITYYT